MADQSLWAIPAQQRRIRNTQYAPRSNSMSYPMFDRSRLHLKPLAERIHDMKLDEVLPLDAPAPPFDDPALPQIAERIVRARAGRRAGDPADGRARDQGRAVALRHRPDGTRHHHPRRHERRGADPRLRAGADRRDHRERGALHPGRPVRPVGRDRLDQRHRRRRRPRRAGLRRGAGAGDQRISESANQRITNGE